MLAASLVLLLCVVASLVAFGFFVCVNWSPFLPSTWEYAKSYTTGQQTVHGSLFFMGRIYHNLLEYGLGGTPPWFYAMFAAVKLAPATFLCAALGLAIAGGGMYTQYRAVDASACLVLPDGATAKDGASSFVNPLTALGMLETMRNEGHAALAGLTGHLSAWATHDVWVDRLERVGHGADFLVELGRWAG